MSFRNFINQLFYPFANGTISFDKLYQDIENIKKKTIVASPSTEHRCTVAAIQPERVPLRDRPRSPFPLPGSSSFAFPGLKLKLLDYCRKLEILPAKTLSRAYSISLKLTNSLLREPAWIAASLQIFLIAAPKVLKFGKSLLFRSDFQDI